MTSNLNSKIILTPVFEDNEAATKLLAEISRIYGQKYFVVVVDDGSTQDSISSQMLEDAQLDGSVIKLTRNIGHQKAIAVGLSYIAENFPHSTAVVMDSDGEDLPESIEDLAQSIDADHDVVVGQRRKRKESIKFQLFYLIYKFLFKALTGKTINFGNFMIIKPNALKRLVSMNELWTHLAGCVLISKLRISSCEIDRGSRYAGESKMNFIGLALHGFKGLMVFSEDVMVRVGVACTFIAFFSLIGALLAILLKIIGYATPGWFSIALGILVLVFIQTGALTLMSLMLTGNAKSGAVGPNDYKEFIGSVFHSELN
jgi:polyisoprenyl-phosphate glycosyltransferase